jgi:hypothetical protein
LQVSPEPDVVILSGGMASNREAITQSKDPYLSTGVPGKRRETLESQEVRGGALIGVLRLRDWFAKQTGRSAQDDSKN